MAIFRVHKNKNYTTMSNYHLQDINLSLKAKGLLSLMLSLPEDWDYSVRGLETICVETKDTINGILNELEKNNYLERKRIYCNGKISNWEYNIFENNLHPKNQDIENQDIENYDINKILNNKKLNNKKEIHKERFIKPTLEEIETYCKERNSSVDPKVFYDYFETGGWVDSKGNKVKNWKQKIITWEKHSTKVAVQKEPIWFDKEQDIKIMSQQEQEEIEAILNSIGE